MLKMSFRQQVLTGFAVSVVLVLAVGILSFKSISQLESDSEQVDHTQKVIKTSTNLIQMLIDAETGVRGYAATGNVVFLDPYKPALPAIRFDMEQLRDLVAGNPEQEKRVELLAASVTEQLGILKANIDAKDTKGLDYMVQNHMLLNGKQNMDQIRILVAQIRDSDNKVLAVRKASSDAAASRALNIIVVGSVIFLVIIIYLFYYIQETLERQKQIENRITITNKELEKVLDENRAKNWLLAGTGTLNEKMSGQQSETELAENILTEVCRYTGAVTGTFYLFNEEKGELNFCFAYAFNDPASIRKTVKLNEGWLGQVAKDESMTVIKGRLNDKLELGSSLVQQSLVESAVVPFFFEKKLKGVIEIAYQDELNNGNKDYLIGVADDIGIAINTAQARTTLHELLSQVQQQTEELEAQQEEMRITNEELVSKTEMLQASEEELIVQQEELRSTNAELEEKASLLEEKNQAIEEARNAIDLKVKELEATGKYKSEFLANMSHELRTPLNSILVLARILQENKPSTLTGDQIKYANVIFNAGNDLLTLINDILDLAKIEAGKVDVKNETVKVADILDGVEMLFAEVARNKNISYVVTSAAGAPKTLFTDQGKVEQVLKNLLSNAFKFTPENGSVSVTVVPDSEGKNVSFRIKDSGIGIPKEKQRIIFEAFQQADGSTSRRFGGTGLGLSISRELVALLAGNIAIISEPGQGSEFTLTIPVKATVTELAEDILTPPETFISPAIFLKPAAANARGDREPLVVIVEDDKNFAVILKDYADEHGYHSIVIDQGAGAFEIIKEKQPDAVILDIMLPGKDGWQVLKELKQDEATQHIPVHLMSAGDVPANRVDREGAISFIKKPVDPNVIDKLFNDIMSQSGGKFKKVLLVEDNKTQNNALKELMENQDIAVDQAFDGASAYKLLDENEYQCVILDLNLPDISGLDFLDKIKAEDRFKPLPVVINTAMELDKNSVNRLMQYANAMVVKTNKSSNRLIDEVNLFLNKISGAQGSSAAFVKPGQLKVSANRQALLKGKKVLVVDDDVRNIFALSSALEGYDMVVVTAGDGQEALQNLEEVAGIDMVLMDIMMPVMDGYEAMRQIRRQNKWAKLPVIALTAKAMKDDKEKCIAAGANDYITKPVDMDRLIALMQLWLGS
jgi:CheY-like chemotaxis protein/CHASE3 domain sensor protein